MDFAQVSTLTSPDRIKVVFNTHFDQGHTQSRVIWYKRSDIHQVKLNSNHIQVVGRSSADVWECSTSPNEDGFLVVSSVNGQVPASLDDLADKLSLLIQ